MKELQDIVQAYEEVKQNAQPAALATLVKVEGSTYRRAGARMLITGEHQWVGALSGGCLESDICDRAQTVIQSNTPQLAVYDTTSDDDIIWGLGLGCQGVAHILIEPIHPAARLNPIEAIAEGLEKRSSVGIATLIAKQNESPLPLGTILLLQTDQTVSHCVGDRGLQQQILSDLRVAIAERKSITRTYASGNSAHTEDDIEVALQVISPPIALTILGAGHDALPVVAIAKQLGWHVTVVDPQSRPSTAARFSLADVVHLHSPAAFKEALDNQAVALTARSVVVVMTHNYHHDLDFLQILSERSVSYIGILGPKSRTSRLYSGLQDKDSDIDQKSLGNLKEQLYSPIGLDIGAETPEEIALSILSEIQAAIAHRKGGSLKHRATPIHQQ